MQKKGLGRGLESLLGMYDEHEDGEVKSVKDNTGVNEVAISLIDPNPKQPRKNFEEEPLNELAQSIKKNGVIQPIVLTKRGDRYMIIAGERRWRASKIADLKTIPAVVKDFDDKQIKEISLIENLQREDLNPIEMARAIYDLMREFRLTQDEVSEHIGKSRPAIANALRLLVLPEEVLKLVEENRLSAGHARCLVIIANKQAQVRLANMACDNKMSVRELEQAVKNILEPKSIAKAKPQQSLELKEFVSDMNRVFATKVTVNGTEQKGKISIEYFTKDDLQRIYELIEKLK